MKPTDTPNNVTAHGVGDLPTTTKTIGGNTLSYQPDFDIDFVRGMVGEDTYKDFLVGKHEVKTDYRSAETGNFYVETEQYSYLNGIWFASGINKTTSDWWVQASPLGYGGIFIKTNLMRELVNDPAARWAWQQVATHKTNASRGKLVKRDELLRRMGL